MANNCSAQIKIQKEFYGSDIRPVESEYLIPMNIIGKTKKYIQDVQNYAYNEFGLGLNNPLMSIKPATRFKNKGYSKVVFHRGSFSKLQKLIDTKGIEAVFSKEALRKYNQLEVQSRVDLENLEDFKEELDNKQQFREETNEAIETVRTELFPEGLEDLSFSVREKNTEADKKKELRTKILKVADRFSNKIGTKYSLQDIQLVNDGDGRWKIVDFERNGGLTLFRTRNKQEAIDLMNSHYNYAGKLQNGVAYINLAHATLDTPIHEIVGHPVIRVIKDNSTSKYKLQELDGAYVVVNTNLSNKYDDAQIFDSEENAELFIKQKSISYDDLEVGESIIIPTDTYPEKYVITKKDNDFLTIESSKGEVRGYSRSTYDDFNGKSTEKVSNLYQNLLKELEIGYGKEVLERVKKNYSELGIEDQQEEALVQLLGEYIAGEIENIPENKGLIKYLRELYNRISDYVKSLIKDDLDINTLRDDMSLGDLAQAIANSERHIILPGYKVEYSTPLGNKYNTLEEVNQEIKRLADANIEVDLSGVNVDTYEFIGDRPVINAYGLPIESFINAGINNGRTNEGIYEDLKKYYKNADAEWLHFNYSYADNWSPEFYGDENPYIPKTDESSFAKYIRDNNIDLYKEFSQSTKRHIEDFIESNKEYEQAREIIEEWKKENNIQYDPEEVYSRGHQFISTMGAFGKVDLELLFQNMLQHLEDYNRVGSKFELSFHTAPIDNRQIVDINRGGGKVYMVAYPQSNDIAWASRRDNSSGSVWEANKKVSNKPSEIVGVAHTKAPSVHNIDTIEPNLAVIIDERNWARNELGIAVTPTNHRIEYDESIPYNIKKLIDNYNKILDDKYGKLVKPEIKKEGDLEYLVDAIDQDTNTITKTFKFDSKEKALKYINDNIDDALDDGVSLVSSGTIFKGKQPTQTRENTTSIESVKSKNTSLKENEWAIEPISPTEYGIFTYMGAPIKLDFNSLEEAKQWLEENKPKQKDYTSQALTNIKVATLKEIARKYPRSLVTSKVVRDKDSSEQSSKKILGIFDDITEEDILDLPFQKPGMSPFSTTESDNLSFSKRAKKDNKDLDVKNGYHTMINFKNNLIDKSKATLHALATEIKKTTNNPVRKQELLDSYETLRDYVYGNKQKETEGLVSQKIEIEKLGEEYKQILRDREDITRDLKEATRLGDANSIKFYEQELIDINQKLLDNKFYDMVPMLHAFVNIDLNRALALSKTGKLEDLQDSLNIINFYKALDPYNTQSINPFFSTEELLSGGISEETMTQLKDLSDRAKQLEDDIYNSSKNVIIDYINSLDYFTRINNGEDYTSEDIFKIASGIPDISALDSYMGNISDNPYSQEQSLLLQAIHKQLEDKIAQEQATVKAIEDKLDDVQKEASKELIRLGHTIENSSENKGLFDKFRNLPIVSKLANRASFNYFKQRSAQGVLKNRLVQQASSSYESFMTEAKNIFDSKVEAIRAGNSKFTYDEVLYQYQNKIRASSHVIKPHLIKELVEDPNFSPYLTDSISYNNAQEEMNSYRDMLIEEIGEIGYRELVESQRILLEDFILTRDNNRRKALEEYREIMGDPNIEFQDIEDIEILDKLENWELDNNPFNIGYLFENNKKFKLVREEESRTNHYSNYGTRGSSIDFNVVIPRKNKVKVTTSSPETVPPPFRVINIETTNEPSNYIDSKFRDIQDNPILYEYWKTIMEASDYYEQTLEPKDRERWSRGNIPLDKNVQLKRFVDKSDSTVDSILSFLSKPFKDMLHKFGESISSNIRLSQDFSDVDVTTNKIIPRVNSAGLNVANRKIYQEVFVLKASQLYSYYQSKGLNISEKSLTRDTKYSLGTLPISFLKEALYLAGTHSEKALQNFSEDAIKLEFVRAFNINLPTRNPSIDKASVNILGLLEDLHIQNNLLESEEDLGLIMRKNMAEASVIQARNKAKGLIEFMAEFYRGIGNAITTSNNKKVTLSKNKGATKIGGERENAKRQLKSFLDNVLYLGKDKDHKSRTLASQDDITDKSFFNRVILGNKDKLDLINTMLSDPNITDRQRAMLSSMRVSESKYVDLGKLIMDPLGSAARFFYLGLKVMTHLNNLQQGQTAVIQMDGTGTYWKKGMAIKAQQVMQQAIVRTLAGNTKLTPAANKARHIIDRIQIIEDASTLEAKALHRNKTAGYLKNILAPYSAVKRVEYINQGVVILSVLMSEDITGRDGEVSNVWEALDKNGKLKDNFRYNSDGSENTDNINSWEKFNTQKYFDLRSKMKESINKTAGNYNFETSSVANNTELGKLVLGLKRWMYELFSVHYGNERISFAAGKTIKGRTKSFTPEEVLIQRLSLGVFNEGGLSALFSALPLYLFELYNHYNARDIDSSGIDMSNRPKRAWKDIAVRSAVMGKIAAKTAVGLPINAVTNLAGIKPLVDMGTDSIFGLNDMSSKLSELGMDEADMGNINAVGRAMGMQMLTLSIMLTLYMMLQGDFGDEEDEEKEALKERKKQSWISNTFEYSRRELTSMAYNLASTGFNDGLMYMFDPRNMYDTMTSIANVEWYTKMRDFSKLLDERLGGLKEDQVASGPNAGDSKSFKALSKFAPVPGRDLDSYGSKAFNEPYVFKVLAIDEPLMASKKSEIMRKEYRNTISEQVAELTEKEIAKLYRKNRWKFTKSTRKKPREIENVRKAYVDKVMEEKLPKPNVDVEDYKQLKKDIKAVIDGEMSSEDYKEKYRKQK